MGLWAMVDIITLNPLKLSFVMFLVSKYVSLFHVLNLFFPWESLECFRSNASY
jgi:hypothetical protein